MSEALTRSATLATPADPEADAERRALAQALGQFLDPQRVDAALKRWSAGFDGNDSLFVRLGRYCREIAQEHGLSAKEAELNLGIFRALQHNLHGKPAVPLPRPTPPRTAPRAPAMRMQAVAAPLPSPSPSLPPASATPGPVIKQATSAVVLQLFYAALEMNLLRERTPGVTRAQLRRRLIRHAAALPHAKRHAVSQWWSGQVAVLGGNWPPGAQGTALVNIMYVALAELLGPVQADLCFTQAVLRLEATKDGSLGSIRSYL